MKRRELLKGSMLAATVAPVLSIADLLASIKPEAQPLPIEHPDQSTEPQGTEFYVNGVQIPDILDVSMEQQADIIEVTKLDSTMQLPPYSDYATFTLRFYDHDGSILVFLSDSHRSMCKVSVAFKVDMFVYEAQAYIQNITTTYGIRENMTSEVQFRTVSPVLISERVGA